MIDNSYFTKNHWATVIYTLAASGGATDVVVKNSTYHANIYFGLTLNSQHGAMTGTILNTVFDGQPYTGLSLQNSPSGTAKFNLSGVVSVNNKNGIDNYTSPNSVYSFGNNLVKDNTTVNFLGTSPLSITPM